MAWWTHLASWVKGLVMTVLQNSIKFNIVSMGSRTNLGDFVLWFAFGTS